ncbi:MAG TPA: transcription termination factor NusA [Fibrobacteraceae bacterium]|jgi:N utilization substance protein A|nr:transcription termination factor NusA [Fibrobacter sp.]HPW94170.1 transcription termination factor NusA [Fibrobacteraceae bacterium]
MKNEPKINLVEALKSLVQDKNVEDSIVTGALKDALISAARKYLQINKKIDVDIDTETDEIRVFLRVEVVDDYPDYDTEMSAEEVEELDEGYMLVQEAQEFNEDAQPGDLLEMEVPVSAFGRQAIQTAKQFLIQRIRTAERDKIYETYRSRIGTMINGEVVRIENKNLIVSIGRQTEAVLPAKEQIAKERFHQGSSVKAVIADVTDSTKGGAQVILSRANGDFLKELFRQEVPEIYEGTVEVKGVSRDPGFRAKIAVYSRDERIDPVGSCVGMKGARVQAIVRELANERIDIVHWNPDFETYVRRSLAPANIVKFVEVSGTRRIVLVVADEDLAQAIGRNGQNVRLASQLVGRDLDVFGEKEWSEKDEETKEKILTPRANEYRQMNQMNDKKMQLDELFTKENTEEQPIEEDGVSMEESEA